MLRRGPAVRTGTACRGLVTAQRPIKADTKGAGTFGLDELWRPTEYGAGTFTDSGDGTVSYDANGLTWEKFGSRYPLTWDRAHAHVARLNRNRYGGRTDWRLRP